MGERDTIYGNNAYWHPDGWCLYADGTTHSWPSDLSAPGAGGLRQSVLTGCYYTPYVETRKHGHLYFLPDHPDQEVSTGRLINDRHSSGGRVHRGRVIPTLPNNSGGVLAGGYPTNAYEITFQKVAPRDGRGILKWRMISTPIVGVAPVGTPDPKTGKLFPQWPPQVKRRRV